MEYNIIQGMHHLRLDIPYIGENLWRMLPGHLGSSAVPYQNLLMETMHLPALGLVRSTRWGLPKSFTPKCKYGRFGAVMVANPKLPFPPVNTLVYYSNFSARHYLLYVGNVFQSCFLSSLLPPSLSTGFLSPVSSKFCGFRSMWLMPFDLKNWRAKAAGSTDKSVWVWLL